MTKKIGRPKTSYPKDKKISIRMDYFTIRTIKYLQDELKISRSEVLRRGVEELYGRVKSGEKNI